MHLIVNVYRQIERGLVKKVDVIECRGSAMSEIVRNTNKYFGEYTGLTKYIPVVGEALNKEIPVIGSVISVLEKGMKALPEYEDNLVVNKIVSLTSHYVFDKQLEDAIVEAILILMKDV